MPQAIAAAAAWVAHAAAVAATTAGASEVLTQVVYATVYYGTQLAVYAGLAYATAPKVPKPEAGKIPYRASRPIRKRGYGRYRTAGPLALFAAKGDKAVNVMVFHAGEIDAVEQHYLHDDLVTVIANVVQSGDDGRYYSPDQRVKLYTRLGLASETAYPEVIAVLPGKWTTAHRGDLTASLAQICTNGKLVHFQHDFPNGEPQPSVVIRAQKVFDPRDVSQSESDPSTWVWSNNPILCLMHYLAYDRAYAYDWTSNEVATFNSAKWDRRFGNTLALWAAAADVCDAPVDLAAGGTEPRYTIGGEYDLSNNESAVVEQMINSMDGWLGTDGRGGFVVYAGQFYAPTVTLTEAHIVGWDIQSGVELESRVNQIVVGYTNPLNKYNEAEAEPWTDDDAIADDGRTLTENLSLPWVQSNGQARRLAKRRMLRHQASCRGTLTVLLSAQAVFGQRYLKIAMAQGPAALQNLIIEVSDSIKVNMASLTMVIPWIAVDPDARDGWVPADEEGEEPSIPDPPVLEDLAAPVIDDAWAWFVDSGPPRMSLHIVGPDRGDLTWDLRWRQNGFTLWQPIETHDEVDDHPTLTLQTGLVPEGVQVEVQSRYRTGGGQASPWSISKIVDTTRPAIPWTADSITVLADSAYFTADGGVI